MARKPRLLWANTFCLADSSSGASISARQMLRQLQMAGVEIRILGATIFDHPSGTPVSNEQMTKWQSRPGTRVDIQDGTLRHELVTTASVHRHEMRSREMDTWWVAYEALLADFRPDAVWAYGGLTLDILASAEARRRGIPYLMYLVNGNYPGTRWARDVRQVITDSRATADRYGEQVPCPVMPVGTFIDPVTVVAKHRKPERLLFVNPKLSKGAGVVAQLAILMAERRPDIIFEVVESRGQWAEVLARVAKSMGRPDMELPNVVVTPHTRDMKSVYARARILLAPSLWWESGARVLAEAMLNGIPAVTTARGGSPEMVGEGGLLLTFPEACHEPPFSSLPDAGLYSPLVDQLIRLYDDEAAYRALADRALAVGRERHDIRRNTERLLAALSPIFSERAGDTAADPVPLGRALQGGA